MTQIKSTIFADSEGWIRENMKDMEVDGFSYVLRTSPWNFDNTTAFSDFDEDGNVTGTKNVSLSDMVKGLRLLCKLIDKQELFVGGIKSAIELVDPCNWDVEVTDAYFQLLYHGEVIYG